MPHLVLDHKKNGREISKRESIKRAMKNLPENLLISGHTSFIDLDFEETVFSPLADS